MSFGPTPLLIVLVVVCLLLVVARLARRRSAEPDPRRPGDGHGGDDA